MAGLIAAVLCMQPFFRAMFLRFVNVVGSASKASFVDKLRRKESVALLPGVIDTGLSRYCAVSILGYQATTFTGTLYRAVLSRHSVTSSLARRNELVHT